ncbi:trypco2 family protein [Actinomadura chokoriensis]|uniref:Trypco2 family protein n=1 Tax=Actinomadura chokoriensis TaxID=454156 RepID=A0ABV4R365_9ACTN
MKSLIGLAEAIEQLRYELGEAQDAGADQQLRFKVTEVEMELLVELRKEGGAKASFGVLSVGAEGKISKGNAHRLKLKLEVKDEALGGSTAEVGDDDEGSFDD